MQDFIPYPGAVIEQSVRLVPGIYDFSGKDGIVVAADNIVIDGMCAHIKCGKADTYAGTGLLIKGRVGVQVKNLSLSGFDIGIQVEDCEGIRLEGCDVSHCFHDPDWGWDDHGDHGGILMLSSYRCEIRDCRAQEVWDALHLRYSNHNLVENNTFSHTSNTGLKMWRSSFNTILNNDLSWGLRISPGEVHARDSSCVLVESGSNNNVFRDNDMTHGGDGFFIRVLNGWMSTGNLMENNDCSYANNNGFEAWADHNTYINNKANHCSYGFWLGNSNYTTLIGNEAAYNGKEFHNAPEAFGNAGITFANGSCSHSIIKNNYIHHNTGPGLAIRNNEQTPSLHVLIEGNRIEHNETKGNFTGHGIYLKHVRQVLLQDNQFVGNAGKDLCLDGNTEEVFLLDKPQDQVMNGELKLDIKPGYLIAGEPVEISASVAKDESLTWDLGDDTAAVGERVEHVYKQDGLYSVSLTAMNKGHVRLYGRSLHILPRGFVPFHVDNIICQEGVLTVCQSIYDLESWQIYWEKDEQRSIRFESLNALFPKKNDCLVLQLQYQGDQEPDWEKKHLYPVLTLYGANDASVTITPTQALLPAEHAPYPEQRASGRILVYPLKTTPGFTCHTAKNGLADGIFGVEINCGKSNARQSYLQVNALGFAPESEKDKLSRDLVIGNMESLIVSNDSPGIDAVSSEGRRLDSSVFKNAEGLTFHRNMQVDQVVVNLQVDPWTVPATFNMIPDLEYRIKGVWRSDFQHLRVFSNGSALAWSFEMLETDGLRLVSLNSPVKSFQVNNTKALPLQVKTEKTENLAVDGIRVKLNKEQSVDGNLLPDLLVSLYDLNEQDEPKNCLASVRVSEALVSPYAVQNVLMPGVYIREGQRYALVLGQASLAVSREAGGYYRWICGKVEGQVSLRTLMDTLETKEMEHNWGTAWMQMVAHGAKTDLVHSSDHVGVRLGLADVPRRYQVFAAPLRASLLVDQVVHGASYIAENEEIIITASEPIREVCVYWQGSPPESLVVKDQHGRLLSNTTQFEHEICRIILDESIMCSSLLLYVVGKMDINELVALS